MLRKNISKIIFAAVLTSSSALAQSIPNELLQSPNTPVVTVGGFINFSAVTRSQSKAYSQDRLPDAVLDANGKVDVGHNDATHNTLGTHNRYSNKYDFVNDSEIYIKVGAISDSGLKYGAIVELEADTSPNGRGNGFNADKSFIFTESKVGKFEFGNNLAANQKMKVGPAIFARAAGGINGKYLEHINLPQLAHSSQSTTGNACAGGVRVGPDGSSIAPSRCDNVKLPRFILIPQSPVGHGGYAKGFYNRTSDTDYSTDDVGGNYGSFNRNSLVQGGNGLNYKNGAFGQMEDATKISYYTPRVNGWQIGASFTPDTGDTGTSAVVSGKDSGDIKNVVSWGLNYSNNMGNLGVAMSATGESGQFENSKLQAPNLADQINRDRLNSYDAGLMFTYFGFTIGGSYGYWGNSLQPNKGIYSCDYDSTAALTSQDCSSTTSAKKKFKSASYYTGGVAYEFGPVAASWTYLSSTFQNNKYEAHSFGIDYKLARGLMPYIEFTKFKFNSNQPKASDTTPTTSSQVFNNSGYVGLVGILFAF